MQKSLHLLYYTVYQILYISWRQTTHVFQLWPSLCKPTKTVISKRNYVKGKIFFICLFPEALIKVTSTHSITFFLVSLLIVAGNADIRAVRVCLHPDRSSWPCSVQAVCNSGSLVLRFGARLKDTTGNPFLSCVGWTEKTWSERKRKTATIRQSCYPIVVHYCTLILLKRAVWMENLDMAAARPHQGH